MSKYISTNFQFFFLILFYLFFGSMIFFVLLKPRNPIFNTNSKII